MSLFLLLGLLCHWAGAQSLDLVTLELAEEQSSSPEYRHIRDQENAETIERLKVLLPGEENEATRTEMALRLGELLYEQGRLQDDAESLRQASFLYLEILKGFPQHGDEAAFCRGRAQLLLGDREDAMTMLQMVGWLWPDSKYVLDANLWLAEIVGVEKAPRAALKAWSEVMATPDHRWTEYATYRVAWAYHHLNEPQKAEDTLRQAAQATDQRIREVAIADLATHFGGQEAPVTTATPVPAPAAAARSAPEPCAAEVQQHAGNVGAPNGPQLKLLEVQCWVAQGDIEQAREGLSSLKLRYGRGTDWHRVRSKAERKRLREAIRQAEVLIDGR